MIVLRLHGEDAFEETNKGWSGRKPCRHVGKNIPGRGNASAKALR